MVQEVAGLARCNSREIFYRLVLLLATLLAVNCSCAHAAALHRSSVPFHKNNDLFVRNSVSFVSDGLAGSQKSGVVGSLANEWRSREQRSGSGVALDVRGRVGRRIRGEGPAEGTWQAEEGEQEQLTRADVVQESAEVLKSRRGGEGEKRRWLKSSDEECNSRIRGHQCRSFPGAGGASFIGLWTGRALSAVGDDTSEGQVLLSWSSTLIDGPKRVLATWNLTSEPNFCLWRGVQCRNVSQVQHVVSINLAGSKIGGSISAGLTGLPYFTSLNLSYNRISGQIPGDLGRMTTLQTVDLRFNRLNGSIPLFCGNSSARLQSLYLNKNKLSGGIPSSLGQCRQLTEINLSRNKLEGEMPTGVGTLANLQMLVLSQNRLSGGLPSSLGSLTALTNLSLDWNQFNGSLPDEFSNLLGLQGLYLNDNEFSGALPDWLSNLANLSVLHLQQNEFEGSIPNLLGNSQKLTSVLLANNSLVGAIPQALVESQGLFEIDMSGNQLNGSIPEELGLLTQLQLLQLQRNLLSGSIPSNLTNCVKLREIDLSENQLSGRIPSLDTFFELQSLRLNDNKKLIGSIPSVTNCVNLIVLDLSNNDVSGSIPDDIGQLENLTTLALSGNSLEGLLPELSGLIHLQTLSLDGNHLNGSIPDDIGQLKELTTLGLSSNSFGGPLPGGLGSLTALTSLTLGNNVLSGSIPTSLGSLVNLQVLSLAGNLLSGGIPSQLSECTNLVNLTLNDNDLNGTIPDSLGQLILLQVLRLQGNRLSGSIPLSFSNFGKLDDLDLSDNELTGQISGPLLDVLSTQLQGNFSLANNRLSGSLPQDLGLLTLVQSLNLSGNFFSGVIPDEIGNCTALVRLDLSKNNLTGPIPSSVGRLSFLQLLNVSHNGLDGLIPGVALGELAHLDELDLTANNLSGEIPDSLTKLANLSFLNVSYNSLDGEVPNYGSFQNFSAASFLGNPGLCGTILNITCDPTSHTSHHKSSLSTAVKVGIAAGVTGFVALIAAAGFIAYRWAPLSRTPQKRGSIIARSELFYPQLRFTAQDLRLATENFPDANVLGTGSLSKVYRGVLPELVLVAVKKLKIPEGTQIPPEFLDELDELGRLRHRYLVAILGYCFDTEMNALVVQYMSNGSLEERLHGRPTCDLDWPTRAKVCLGVAKALTYLHHDCGSTIVHCDLKPSNVLLDSELDGHLEDFGLSRLIFAHKLMDMTNSSVGSSVGYFPPEYANSPTVSTKGDVYSYGILLLEVLTGKKPTLDMFKDDMSLTRWCQAAFPGRISDVLYPTLVGVKDTNLRQVTLFMKVALMCAKEDPEERPTMKTVLEMLK